MHPSPWRNVPTSSSCGHRLWVSYNFICCCLFNEPARMRNSCHYVDGEMRPSETEGFARSTLAEPASIHPSLHLLTRSKEAFLSLKRKEIPQIVIFSQGVTRCRKGSPCWPASPRSQAGPNQPQAGGQLSRTRECRDECEERQGEESCSEIPLSPFLIRSSLVIFSPARVANAFCSPECAWPGFPRSL